MDSTTAQLKVAHDVIKIKIQVNLLIKESQGDSAQIVLINVIGCNNNVSTIILFFKFLPQYCNAGYRQIRGVMPYLLGGCNTLRGGFICMHLSVSVRDDINRDITLIV